MRFLSATLILLLAITAPALVRAGPLERAEKFRPDVYPGKIQAVDGAARRVVDALNASIEFTERGSTIAIAHNAMCAEANDTIVTVLMEHFPAAEVLCAGSARPESIDTKKLVMIEPGATEEQDTITEPSKRVRIKGTVTLQVKGGGVDRAFTTKFIEKPWAADFKAWAADRPNRFYLGQSTKLHSSEADALKAAREQAAKTMYEPLKDEMNARNAKRSDRIMVTESFMRQQLESLFRQGKHVEDTFVQCLAGPSGEVWRASILVNASPGSIDSMVAHMGNAARASVAAQRAAGDAARARRSEQARGFGSVAAFCAVIVMLYLLVNSLTKGYFVWRLRAAALLLGIVGILVALAVT